MSTDFMSLHRPGIGNASSYQVSAKPFVSSSITVPVSGSTALTIQFPQVSKFITIRNLTAGSQMRLGFSDAGVKGTNYYLILGGEVLTTEIKANSIVLMSHNGTPLSASLLVGLTNIPASELVNNWSGSAGVG